MDCLLGLGFDARSEVNINVEQAYGSDVRLGQSVLSNIFDQYPHIPRSFDLFLNRSRSNGNTADGGMFAIGQHLGGVFANVTEHPKLPTLSGIHWTLAVETLTINNKSLTPNPYRNASVVPELNRTQKLGGTLDTGATGITLPDYLWTEYHNQIEGAFYDEVDQSYVVPCTAAINFSITFMSVRTVLTG